MKCSLIYTTEDILKTFKSKSRPDQLLGMARYGISTDKRFGIAIPCLRKLAKGIGKNHQLALELWKTGYAEAKILAAMIDEVDKVTEEQMEDWVKDIDSWDICDQTCMNLFEKTPFVIEKIHDWSVREEEFVKRAAYALIACLAWHDKEVSDQKFIDLFPIIKQGATDDRNYVKKAINWAIRNIGKRNLNLNKEAIKLSKKIQKIDSKPARWIASNALKELESEKVQERLRKRN